MKVSLRTVDDHGVIYSALMFVCPGCLEAHHGSSGIHMLPVNSTEKSPSWDWDGNLEAPTLSPSILTKHQDGFVCHSFLKAGVFEFLTDSTHSLAGKLAELPDLPSWSEED